MINNKKSKSAITLIALIITIIVLLILATISISLVINNGILDNAKHGVDRYSEEEELEQIKLAVASAMLKGNGFLTTENLKSELQEKFGNDKVEKIESNWYYKEYSIDEKGVVEKDKMCSNGVKSGNLTINPALKKEKDLEPTEFNITCNSDSDNVLRIGGWSDNHWTPIGKYYYTKIYDNLNNIIFNGIPCYRKIDNKIGLYDLVEGIFYTNQGTGNFSKGKDM